MNLLKELEKAKKRLEKLISMDKPLDSKEVLAASKKLDKIILEYQKTIYDKHKSDKKKKSF
ncbi:Spo0E like sporulation regulatory protein [Anaerobacterium chartisolvens]|uniref:Spo0E like sporulation regulatory protein n=1 Tax=Anaerobacterium chartisolvens TaxID=1297424 RepID=A0A369BAV8_9FIRM|nr:aspartyl-phosphate phosphatase Spo0E family protein [Anaerobacterium chartisolvens]RCX16814.1 Spo0E like sporulation regulatory protein [Anaerobacterium chartisolvens]